MKLVLVRHAESTANLLELQNGDINDQLSTMGIKQAQDLSSWFGAIDFIPDRFITSNWSRAIQTSQIIYPTATWEVNPKLGETDAGLVSRITKKDFNEKYPTLLLNHRNKFPGGESHADLFERVESWWRELLESSTLSRNIICVAHSGSISCILQLALGLDISAFPAFLVPNCSVSIIEILDGRARIKMLSYSPLHSTIEKIFLHESRWP